MKRPDYRLFVPFILRWEGGYVNDPIDRGGETNKGITRATFNALADTVLGIEPTDWAFKNMTEAQAELFIKHYWDKATYNNSVHDQAIAEAITSWNWGSGRYGLMTFQRLLNDEFGEDLAVDGIIGAKTVNAANQIHPPTLLSRMIARRERFFRDLAKMDPSQERFLKGWLNRLQDFADRHKKKLHSDPQEYCSHCPHLASGSSKDQKSDE